MPKASAKVPITLLVDDQGARLYLESGQLLGRMPEAEPGTPLKAAWVPALRELAEPGAEVLLLLDHSALQLQCQESPALSPREQRDVAVRVFAAEGGTVPLESSGAQDPDPGADGGRVLWLAAQPRPA